MNTENRQNCKYVVFKALKVSKPVFVDIADSAAVEELRSRYGNQGLLVSTWYSASPDMSALRNYSLCFQIVSDNVEKIRVSAIEACLYISENFGIPQESMEIV